MDNATKKTINTDKLKNTESANLEIITEKANSGKVLLMLTCIRNFKINFKINLKLLNEYVCHLLRYNKKIRFDMKHTMVYE